MSDPTALRDRYHELIDQIVQMTLKGQIRSKEQVYQMLVDRVQNGTGELFEYCLGDRLTTTQHQVQTQTDELKQAKATRSLRALQTIQGEWERWQTQNQVSAALEAAIQQIIVGESDPLLTFLSVTDPNRTKPFDLSQWRQIAKALLEAETADNQRGSDSQRDSRAIGQGVLQGLESWSRLENHLVSWIYDQSRTQLGFGGVPGDRGPWALWAKQVQRAVPQSLFHSLALNQSAIDWAHQQPLTLMDMVELVVILRCLQQGLVNWFDKLVYDAKVGAKLSISAFLVFSVIWSQLATGLQQQSTLSQCDSLVNGCFQMTLQILRTFAQRDYFPLYGGIFASFTGEYLRDALSYLDEPLRQADKTQEKARILTLIGSSARAMGQIDRAIEFHQQAIGIAQTAADRRCEVANLNHLSRTYLAQSSYGEAINYSQRALILSRQTGDRLGEANALANLGYSEVLQANQLEQTDTDVYEMAIDRLQQGLQFSEKLGDPQSQALCLSSLGIAQIMLDQPQVAISYLETGLQTAQFAGDVYLQGLDLAYLAEAHHRLGDEAKTLYTGGLAMYLLEQIGSSSWRQPAGLLMVLKGHLGEDAFSQLLAQQRPLMVAVIGVDGVDHLPVLLEQYQRG